MYVVRTHKRDQTNKITVNIKKNYKKLENIQLHLLIHALIERENDNPTVVIRRAHPQNLFNRKN